MLFDVRSHHRDGWCVVAVTGDVDLASMPGLSAHLRSAAAPDPAEGRGPTHDVALDLSGVDLFDPLAAGVVVAADLAARRRRGRFVVVCPPGRPRELLAETRLDTVVAVVDDVAQLPAPSGSR